MDDLQQMLLRTMQDLKEKLPERSEEIDIFKTAEIMATFSRERFRESGDKEDLDVTVTLEQFVHDSHPPIHPVRRTTSYNLSLLLYKRHQLWEDGNDLEKAIAFGREASDLCPEDHPDRARTLGNLASFVLTRFEKNGNSEDLNETISLRRDALRLRPNGHPDRCIALNNLANSLSTRFNRSGIDDDLDEAISLRRAVLDLRPEGHPSRSGSLGYLASSLLTRFQRSGNEDDIEESISLFRTTLDLLPSEDETRPGALGSHANALFGRFEKNRSGKDLDESIALYRSALGLRPRGHAKHLLSLFNLAKALMSRFSLNGNKEDVDELVSLYRAALSICPDGHPDRAIALNNLANALLTRFERNGNTEELDESIVLYRTALNLRPDGHPDRAMSLLNLANSLLTRFEQSGEGLDESVSLYREALQLRPDGHPERFSSLNNLANSLLNRFWQLGCGEDLDESISLFRAALDLLPSAHQDRAASLSNLAVSLLTRFQQSGNDEDVSEANSLFRISLDLRPVGQPDRFASLTNLACSLLSCFERNKNEADLDEVTSLQRSALEFIHVGHPEYLKLLNNLGTSLSRRFELSGKGDVLDEAISIYRTTLDICPDDHPLRSMVMNNLASSLLSRFRQNESYGDLDESVSLLHGVLHLIPEDHPDRTRAQFDLATCFHNRLQKTGHGDDLEGAIEHLRLATANRFSSYLVRLKAVQRWASLARAYHHHTTLTAYRNAISLLQSSLTVRATLSTQRNLLESDKTYRTLATDAASYAIEIGDFTSAIELLEEGRAVLWSQMRGLRTPLDRLVEVNKTLAEKFATVSRRLESLITSSGAPFNGSDVTVDGKKGMKKELLRDKMLMRMRQLSQEQDTIIAEIRQISGFEDFLRIPSFESLRRAASEGPVVILNHSKHRSDALIISTNNDVPCACIPLDKEWWTDSLTLWDEFYGVRVDRGEHTMEYDEVLRRVMKTIWDRVVSNVVDKLRDMGIFEGSRIWWCPTSVLASFPFHAAGPYQSVNGTNKYLLDDYISSYTPTLMALITARTGICMGSERFLFIGDTRLRSTRKERDVIRKHRQIKKCLEDKEAAPDAVLKAIKKTEWAHFACHGRMDVEEPFRSSFALPAGDLTLLDIAKSHPPNAEFAFLSACHTAELPPTPALDEVLHLAAGMQFCGFRSVIGTMWRLLDRDGPILADAVYTYLKRDISEEDLRFKMSAAAVREAALHRRQRKEEGENGQDVCVMTERWVNLIHIGA